MYVNMDALILLTITYNINNARFLTHLKMKNLKTSAMEIVYTMLLDEKTVNR